MVVAPGPVGGGPPAVGAGHSIVRNALELEPRTRMNDRIVLDYNNMLAPRLDGRGLEPGTLRGVADRFGEIHEGVESRVAAGELEVFGLPDQRDLSDRVLAFAADARADADAVLVLGIGGSALGTIALRDALLPPFWNELSDDERRGAPRLYVLDNVDPTTVAALLDRLDPDRTLVDVVSKSGTTAETMAQFQIVREWLRSSLGEQDFRRRLVFTTDPDQGVLRTIAREEDITTFPVPPGVGGRFSVLSAVGLLPAAIAGVDVAALLAGARAMTERCATPDLAANPAGLFAALQYLADARAGAPIHVMMAYSDRLYGAADWFRQLWAESLGKRLDRDGNEVFRGPTPLKALGATDQHSQVQLYMEGPFDKTVTFLAVTDPGRDVRVPRAYAEVDALEYLAERTVAEVDALEYLGDRTLGELLEAERTATALALAEAGRMNMTIELPTLSAHTIGQLLMMLQIATLYAGDFYDVNPLDQPGVELGKRLTYGLMGRDGYQPPSAAPPSDEWISR